MPAARAGGKCEDGVGRAGMPAPSAYGRAPPPDGVLFAQNRGIFRIGITPRTDQPPWASPDCPVRRGLGGHWSRVIPGPRCDAWHRAGTRSPTGGLMSADELPARDAMEFDVVIVGAGP